MFGSWLFVISLKWFFCFRFIASIQHSSNSAHYIYNICINMYGCVHCTLNIVHRQRQTDKQTDRYKYQTPIYCVLCDILCFCSFFFSNEIFLCFGPNNNNLLTISLTVKLFGSLSWYRIESLRARTTNKENYHTQYMYNVHVYYTILVQRSWQNKSPKTAH